MPVSRSRSNCSRKGDVVSKVYSRTFCALMPLVTGSADSPDWSITAHGARVSHEDAASSAIISALILFKSSWVKLTISTVSSIAACCCDAMKESSMFSGEAVPLPNSMTVMMSSCDPSTVTMRVPFIVDEPFVVFSIMSASSVAGISRDPPVSW